MRMTEAESGSPRETAIAVGEQRLRGQTFPPAGPFLLKCEESRPKLLPLHPKKPRWRRAAQWEHVSTSILTTGGVSAKPEKTSHHTPRGAIKDEGRAANRPSTANATASRGPGPPLQMSRLDQPERTE